MRNLVTKEYRDLISKKLFLEREIDKLPIGYISKKTMALIKKRYMLTITMSKNSIYRLRDSINTQAGRL